MSFTYTLVRTQSDRDGWTDPWGLTHWAETVTGLVHGLVPFDPDVDRTSVESTPWTNGTQTFVQYFVDGGTTWRIADADGNGAEDSKDGYWDAVRPSTRYVHQDGAPITKPEINNVPELVIARIEELDTLSAVPAWN